MTRGGSVRSPAARTTVIVAIVLTVLAAACTPTDSTVPSEQPAFSSSPGVSSLPLVGDGAVDYAIADLAERFGYDPDEITVTSIEAVEWPSGALGCLQTSEEDEPGGVPGYRIDLTADDQGYEYHGAAGDSEPVRC